MLSKPSRKSVVVFAIGLAVAIQFVPIRRDNPPVTSTVTGPAPVVSILERACANCHSHDTKWPWYSYVAPASWLVVQDVNEGRRHLDLSAWAEYAPTTRAKKRLDIVEELQQGDMPPWYYKPLHSEASLTQDEVNAVVEWAKAQSAESP
jgi:hypothetical protein